MSGEPVQQQLINWGPDSGRRPAGGPTLRRWLRSVPSIIPVFLLLIVGLLAWRMDWIATVAPRFENAAITAARYAGLVVREIRINGSERADNDAIAAALEFSQGDLLFELDMAAARQRVESLPWIKRAAITRFLPDMVKVEVIEFQPFALWQNDHEVWLVDREGAKITRDNIAAFKGLPYLIGIGAPENAEELIALLKSEPELAARTEILRRVGNRRWDLQFDTGARVRLPEPRSGYGPRSAWARFAALQASHDLLGREIAIFDLRFDDRLILRATPEGLKKLIREDQGT